MLAYCASVTVISLHQQPNSPQTNSFPHRSQRFGIWRFIHPPSLSGDTNQQRSGQEKENFRYLIGETKDIPGDAPEQPRGSPHQ